VEQKRITAELNIAKAELAERSIVSKIDGVIVNRLKEPGEAVNEADPILHMAEVDRILVLFHLETSFLTKLKKGDPVTLTFSEVEPAVVKTGTIHFIDPLVDPRSGLFRLRVLVDNKDNAARPGMKALWTLKR
jgi:membrane fusion protein, multidrug efflux system